ncbi:MAG: RagB/SusD family nutrient uptake outer membrane protein [Bacteroidales bacterium]|nr:RagB/SusD family nutrient uptake outer membrane protein [Bacteroidales bacterium]
MKKLFNILTVALLIAGLAACESLKLGDEGLSKAPETAGATIDTLFASLKDSDKVLASAYYYLPYGLISDFDSKMGKDIVESITDHFVSNKHTEGDGPNDLYYTGALGANISGDAAGGENYRFGSEKDYTAIRYAWFFLENADNIPNAEPYELARKKAEAKLIIAIAYANMVRYVGGVPLIDHSIKTDEEMNFPRNTFKETIDYIVQLCDEAAPDLPWYIASKSEDGRLTKAAALGLKLRILCFAASPTFNSDTPWHSSASDWENVGKYVRYGEKYDKGLWDKAKAAANEFMSAWNSEGYYALVQAIPTGVDATGATVVRPADYRLAYRKSYRDRGTTETLISVRKSNSTSYHDKNMDLQDDFGCGGTLDWVNRFPYADGTPFPEDFNWSNPPGGDRAPFFMPDANGDLLVDGKPTATETRDPRLYENLCVPGDLWKNGNVGPNYVNAKSPSFQDGNTGFLQMKFIYQTEADRNVPPHWCLMRLAEVLLNAAEAYNEADGGPSDLPYQWINAVRARVGLPGVTEGLNKEQFREALILERDLEFGFEEVRWFDMVRWGLTKAFTTKLKALEVTGNKQKNATSFTFKLKDAYPPRVWYNTWDTKWYLAPIPAVEINKNYGMTQNPGW